jgi:hypothetical protein
VILARIIKQSLLHKSFFLVAKLANHVVVKKNAGAVFIELLQLFFNGTVQSYQAFQAKNASFLKQNGMI